MAVLKWSDTFSVNVKEIDDQHKMLVEMINTLHNALKANKGRDVHNEIISKMAGYAKTHFKTEEKYMIQYNFMGYYSHKIEHDQFVVKALDLKERLEKSDLAMTLEIYNFLTDWLVNHILGTDKKYSQHFNNNGLY